MMEKVLISAFSGEFLQKYAGFEGIFSALSVFTGEGGYASS